MRVRTERGAVHPARGEATVPNVPNDSPELRIRLEKVYEGGKPNISAAMVLWDWLIEQGDERATDVREIAEAQCVLPEYPPRQVLERYRAESGGRSPELPMACGRWWVIVRIEDGVAARVYPWSRWYDDQERGEALVFPPQSDDQFKAAFASMQARLVCQLFRHWHIGDKLEYKPPDDPFGLLAASTNT
jgi:hypothetical protein